MTQDLIVVRQLPVIEERLLSLKELVDAETKEAMSLACTDETLQSVKASRAKLRKQFQELEEQRKAVKSAVMGPYEQFEDIYKRCVSDAYRQADADLKQKIQEVEDGIKYACQVEIERYFSELCAVENVGWLQLSRMGLKIDLASARQKSHKKLKEQVKAFVEGVSKDVTAISGMDNADEIMAEYKRCLDLARSVATVTDRHKRIEEEHNEAEQRNAVQESQKQAVERVEALAPPTIVQEPKNDSDTVYTCAFTVHATIEKLKKLKAFLEKEGIEYE